MYTPCTLHNEYVKQVHEHHQSKTHFHMHKGCMRLVILGLTTAMLWLSTTRGSKHTCEKVFRLTVVADVLQKLADGDGLEDWQINRWSRLMTSQFKKQQLQKSSLFSYSPDPEAAFYLEMHFNFLWLFFWFQFWSSSSIHFLDHSHQTR